jgi:hypothetical protein
MRLNKFFVSLMLVLLLASSSFAYTLSGEINGAQWFGGITYVYAISLDVLNPQILIGLALLGNGTYHIFNAQEGNYIFLAFQDQDGNLIPSLDDYLGFYGDVFPELVEVSGNMSDLDIEVSAMPVTTVTGVLSCPEGYTGLTFILAASDPNFEDIVTFGIPLTLDGNIDYTLFVDPGDYYILAYLDADFSFSRNSADPQIFYGAPGSPVLINVSSSPAENIDLPMMVPPDINIGLDPVGPPIVIPASGGSFDYTVTGENQGLESVAVDFWIDVTPPGGTVTDPLLGPVNITLPVGFYGERDRFQNVPGSAPAGIYSYNGYAGIYPVIVWDESSLTFEKTAADGMGGASNWETGGDALEGWINDIDLTSKPSEFELIGAYPNPFNPSTVISYQLAGDSEANLSVYNIFGQQVAELVDGWREAGTHEVTFDASGLPSGVFIYRLTAGDFSTTRKLILMK